mmetsp:Transcript_11167/g.24993  ORF Transcript_11167/g.24993 Transcript_11167/m.24993 type:complete len:241 (+) Transcript_11167:1751-2473(+)
MLPQSIVVVLDGLLVVVGLHHGLTDLLNECRVSLALVHVHRLLKRLDGVSWLLDSEEGVPEDQVILRGGLVIHNGLVAPGIGLLVLLMLEVDVSHGSLCTGKLRVLRLYRLQHVDSLVDLVLFYRQLAVGNQNLHLLRCARELCDGLLDYSRGVIQALQLHQCPNQESEDGRSVRHAQHHHRVHGLLGFGSDHLDAGEVHSPLEHLAGRLELPSCEENLSLHEHVQGVIANGEVVAESLL